jgi:predicted acyl esterase
MRRLNGPQTTGRNYHSLSEPQYHTRRDDNVAIAMRDGTALMADVHRPDAHGRFPALIAASPAARARGQAANRRLHTRWLHFDQRKKHPAISNAAIARELAGWCWSLAVMSD